MSIDRVSRYMKGSLLLLTLGAFLTLLTAASAYSSSDYFYDKKQAKKELRAAANQRRFSDGLELARKAAIQFKSDGEIGNYEAYFLQVFGRLSEAKKVFLRVGEQANDRKQRSYAYARLSSISNTEGDRKKALYYAQKADKIAPLASTKAALGNLLYTQGKYLDSISYFKKAIQAIPSMNYKNNLSDYRLKRGLEYDISLSLYRLGQKEKSAKLIEKIKREAKQKNDSFYCVSYYALCKRPDLAAKELDLKLSRADKNRRKAILKSIARDRDGEYAFISNYQVWKTTLNKWKQKVN